MKKRKLALLGLAAVATLSLASCGGDDEKTTSKPSDKPSATTPGTTPSTSKPTSTGQSTVERVSDIIVDYQQDSKGLDIALNYQAKQGITLLQNSFENKVENTTYTKGMLLPTWTEFGKILKTEIREASAYSAKNDNEYYTLMQSKNFKSETDTNQEIDLFYNSTGNIIKMGAAGEAVNLLDYIEYMPNFEQFLEKNPSIKSALLKDGKIYYTPYFDGYNAIERMLVMDVNMVAAVLDDANADFDTNTTNGGANPSANVVQAGNYEPFIHPTKNYAADTKVSVSKDAKLSEITIKQTDNIIVKQNELLDKGCTGKELALQLQDYLTKAFGHEVGADKTYSKLSDIYTSESAAYNADELIALMRVIKANPGLITKDKDAEIEMLVPRGATNNRVDNVADFMSIWGIQGLDAEYEMMYFDNNGKLNDGASTVQSYEAVQLLSAIYNEGLILSDFWNSAHPVSGGTGFLNKYFGKTSHDGGYGFMLYDYSASTGAVNSIDSGIGTDDSKRVGVFANTSVTGVMPVLPPLTYWATGSEWDVDQALLNHEGKELVRYAESNRALKNNSWCIPTNSDNKEKAAQLMDYLLTTKGSQINDFGPNAYWAAEMGSYAGKETPILSDKMKEMIAASGTDFWSYMRGYIGSTHGIGYVRSASINYQATNKWAQIGTLNIENAISSGAVVLAMVDKYSTYTYDTSVPTAGYGNPDKPESYDAITSFWASDKSAATPAGWVSIVIAPYGSITNTSTASIGIAKISGEDYSLADVYAQIKARREVYLYQKVRGIDRTLIPDYAKAE